jgi:PAS domain S-box-containing protein
VEAGTQVSYEEELHLKTGRRYFHTILVPVLDANGRVHRLMGVARDISERKRTENIMQARLRLLEFAGSHSMSEFLMKTLDEIESLTASSMSFYQFLEPDQRTIRLQGNWSKNTLRQCAAPGKGSHYDISEAGVWADCIRERRPVMHNDYASLPSGKGMPDGHPQLVRELVVPIFRGTLIEAVVAVGNKPTDYSEDDIEMVSQLGDLSLDITKRKRAEEALRNSEERLAALFRVAPVCIAIHGPDGRLLHLNTAARELLGISGGEAIGKGLADPAWRFLREDGSSMPVEEFPAARVLRRRTPVTNQTVGVLRAGREDPVWCLVNALPRYEEDGSIVEAIVTFMDITERMRAEQAVRESEERFKILTQATFEGIAITEQGKLVDGNDQLFRMLGYKRKR